MQLSLNLVPQGDSLTLEESQISTAVKFVCRLYGDTKCRSLNELRCQMAEKGVPVRKIPPTEDSFMLHDNVPCISSTSGNMPTFQFTISPQPQNMVMRSLKMEH